MTLNPVQARDLTMLREASQQRDHEQIQFYLKRLLTVLPYYYALAVVAERVHEFLPHFEAAYPDEAWVRRLLTVIGAYGTAPDEGVAEMALGQDFGAPGAMNFLKAVYDLTQAMQDKHTGEARVGFMTSAAVNAGMAGLVHAYYAPRPYAWQRVRANTLDPATGQYSDPEATQIAYGFWTDADTAARDSAYWLSLADSIDAALRR